MPVSVAIKCSSPEAAQNIEKTLQRKYDQAITITKVAPIKPQVKISIVFTDLTHTDEIIAQLGEQNAWLKDAEFSINRTYVIETASGEYINIIINCGLELQKVFIQKGAVIFGVSECRCFEHANKTNVTNV